MSITAASGEQLAKQGITDTAQLAKLVPGFTYQQSNYGNPVFAIRGIGFVDNSVTAGSTVSVYIDQIPLPFEIGRASCRERVVSVRVDLGGGRSIKKKTQKTKV